MDEVADTLEVDKGELENKGSQIEALEPKSEDTENRSFREYIHIRGHPETITALKETALNLFTALCHKWLQQFSISQEFTEH